MTPALVEREVKLAAPTASRLLSLPDRLRELGLQPGPGRVRQFHDLYLDTPDRWLARAGLGFRLRRGHRRWVAALKSSARSPDRVERFQMEEAIPSPPRAWPSPAPGRRLRAWLRAAGAGDARLSPVAELKVRRAEWPCRDDDNRRYLVCADSVLAVVGGHRVRFAEAEIEAVSPAVPLRRIARRLSRETGWPIVTASKLERALAAADALPALLKPARPEVRPDDPPVRAAAAFLEAYWRQYLRNVPGAGAGADPEYLHDLRVAIRRLRAAYAAFRPRLPPRFRPLFCDLRRVARAAGAVRDLDVAIEQLADVAPKLRRPHHRAAARLIGELWAARARRHARLRRLLAGVDHRQLVRRFERALLFLRRADDNTADETLITYLTAVATSAGRKASKAVARLHKRSPDVEFHSARIRCKKYRYLLEFLAAAVDRRSLRKDLARLVRLQDTFGQLQDAAVLRRLLEDLGAGTRSRRRRALTVAFGRRVERRIRRARRKALKLAALGVP